MSPSRGCEPLVSTEDRELLALRVAMAAYQAAPVHQRALMRLRGEAPRTADRRRLHHLEIGVHGRIAETVLRLVAEEAVITQATVDRGLEQDLTLEELRDIREELLGRYLTAADTAMPALSLQFENDGAVAQLLARLLPGSLEAADVELRRYAALTDGVTGRLEPFLVYGASGARGAARVLGRLWLDGAFLRHEQEFGSVVAADLAALEALVAADLRATLATTAALLPGAEERSGRDRG